MWGQQVRQNDTIDPIHIQIPDAEIVASAPEATSTAEPQQPLTRRRARALATPGVSASADDRALEAAVAEIIEPAAADAVSSTTADASVVAESVVASTADHVAESPVAEPVLVEPAVADTLVADSVVAETAPPETFAGHSSAGQSAAAHSPAAQPVGPEPAAVTAPFELLEPVDVPTLENEQAEAATAESPVDEFAAAAKLFSFTGETPVQAPRVENVVDEPLAEPHVGAHHAAKGRKAKKARKAGRPAAARTSAKRVAAASFSVAVVGVVGLLTVGMTLPQQAIAAVSTADSTENPAAAQLAGDVATGVKGKIQAYVAPADAAPISAADLDRSGTYSTGTLVELAGTTGISNLSSKFFTNDPQCPIQWPFAVGVPITYGFGPRPGEFHEGVDFTPGAGAHIQAIADGVVRVATESGGGYGVMIIIDHMIDGKLVSSRYAHMQHGSLQVHAGEKVQVGEYIGRTGNTGFSFGAHTHLEILMNGTTPIDPLPWLHEHAHC